MSRWNGRTTALTPELIELAQQIYRLRSTLPTWDQLERATGIKAETLRKAARGRTPKRLSPAAGKIST